MPVETAPQSGKPAPAPPVRFEVVALLTTAVAIPGYAFSSGYFQYLGYPAIRAANAADLANLALTVLPVVFVFIVPAVIAYLHYTPRLTLGANWKRAPVFALWLVLTAIFYFALMFDGAIFHWLPHSIWKLIGAAGAGGFLAFALDIFKADLRRGDFGGIQRSAVFVALLTVAFYGAGYAKGLSDYWGPPASIIGPDERPAIVFLSRGGLCIYRGEDEREPTISDSCNPISARFARADHSWTPTPD